MKKPYIKPLTLFQGISNDILLEYLWNKCRIYNGLNPDLFRLDACGALIMKDKFGLENIFGWNIDHIIPIIKGGDNSFFNLRALHYKNIYSKQNDYPSYTAIVHYDGKTNIDYKNNLTVNIIKYNKLKELYKLKR